MRIGVPKEIKTHEYRVGLTPAGVRELKSQGHEILVETQAGASIGLSDAMYQSAGATMAKTAAQVFADAEMVVKVKEPQAIECKLLREGQVLFTYLHLAPDPEQGKALVKSGCVAIAYETVSDGRGGLPLLAPMSEVAGRMSIQAGAHAMDEGAGRQWNPDGGRARSYPGQCAGHWRWRCGVQRGAHRGGYGRGRYHS